MLNIMFPFNHYNNPLRLIYVIHKKNNRWLSNANQLGIFTNKYHKIIKY